MLNKEKEGRGIQRTSYQQVMTPVYPNTKLQN